MNWGPYDAYAVLFIVRAALCVCRRPPQKAGLDGHAYNGVAIEGSLFTGLLNRPLQVV